MAASIHREPQFHAFFNITNENLNIPEEETYQERRANFDSKIYRESPFHPEYNAKERVKEYDGFLKRGVENIRGKI